MISSAHSGAELAAQTLPQTTQPASAGLPEPLRVADEVFWWLGLAVAVGAILAWLFRGRRGLLATAPQRPNRLLPEHVLAVMIGYAVAMLVLQQASRVVFGDEGAPMLVGNIVQLGAGLGCLLVGWRLFDGGVRGFLGTDRRPIQQVMLGLILLPPSLTVCAVVYHAAVAFLVWVDPGFSPPEHPVVEALRTGTEPTWVLRVGAVLVAPFAEELFFRGLLQTALRNMAGSWAAVLVASVFFSLAHAQQPQVVPTLFALSVILGVTYERSGSLIAPLVLHATFNLKTVSWEALMTG